MFSAIIVTLIVVAALAYALRSTGGAGSLIVRRPYNNRYSDAAGAREDPLRVALVRHYAARAPVCETDLRPGRQAPISEGASSCSSSEYLPAASWLPASGYSPVKQASQWDARPPSPAPTAS
jgi:hypothetical protein